MGFFLFAIVLGIVSELLWLIFYREGKKHFTKYDKENSKVVVLNTEEVVSKLEKNSNLVIENIVSEQNQVSFTCQKNDYIINVENGTAYVDYDMSGCEIRVSLIGKLKKRFKFWKSAHKAILVNMIMDTLQNDSLVEQKSYKKTKTYAKAAVVAFVSFLIFLVIGFCSFENSVSNTAVSDAKAMEFCNGVTYEELIETYLIDAEWSAFNAERDIAVVEVTGTSVEGEDICIQFWGDTGMGLSYRSLTLEICEVDGVSLDPDAVMEYIYSYYYTN